MQASVLLLSCVAAGAASAAGVAPHVDPEAPSSWSQGDTPFSLFKLAPNNAFGALSLDGTPGAFYWREGSSDNWAFYFQGGGWCYSLADCYGRSLGNLGSSKALPSTGTMGGLLSDDCTVSPLCNYNVVWLAYTDGNSFSGQLADPVYYNNSGTSIPLYFRGRAIIDAVVDAVSKNVMGSTRLLKNAVNLVETGCSAGGLATYLHADYVRDLIPHTGAYYSLPISGYFLDYPSVFNGTYIYSQQIQNIYKISNASTNAACQAHYTPTGDDWKCNMAEYVYPFIGSNQFVLNSMCDSWQTGCVLTAMPVTSPSQNGNCGSAPGWEACSKDPTKCTSDMIQHGYLPFSEYMTTSIQFINAAKSTAPGNGGFLTSCHTHCEAQGGGFDTFKIGNTTMFSGVTAWMAANANPSAPAPSSSFWSVDCFYTTTGNHVCNPSCSA